MKKCINLMLVTLLSMCILVSCKKSTSKDYSLSVKDKTWWGVFTYTGQPLQYYSVHFNADNTLSWSQLSGNYPGQWTISDRHITFTLAGTNVLNKADISDADTLMNISANSNTYVINSCKLVANPPISLDNTSWSGTITISGTPYLLLMSFMPGLKVKVSIGGSVYPVQSYTSSPSGAMQIPISSASYLFAVIAAGNEMKGCEANPATQWHTTKQ